VLPNFAYIATTRYGYSWLHRPIVLFLIVLTLVLFFYPFLRYRKEQTSEKDMAA